MGNADDDDLNVERSFDRRPRRRLRTRASPREVERFREWLAAGVRREAPGLDEAQVHRRVDAELEHLCREYPPGVVAALDRMAPSSRSPRRNGMYFWPELAAALALPACVTVLRQMTRTLAKRGPASDLSGAAASLIVEAAKSGANIALASFDELTGSAAARWALANPTLPDSDSQRYRGRIRITGRRNIPGHDAGMLSRCNIELIHALRSQTDAKGRPCHPRIGQVGIIDAQRLAAPVEQVAPRGPGYLKALRRPGMELVAQSTYKHAGQYDTVIGWKLALIVDQATMVPLVWKIVPGNAVEREVLLDDLLPTLFGLWPQCPMHTLVGDAHYDTRSVCTQLEECYSLHPVFTRPTKQLTTVRVRGGRQVKLVDGRPPCRCGAVRFRGRQGFYSVEHRLRDGRRRGKLAPSVKDACIRWACPNGLCQPVSLWHQDDPCNYTWFPRGGDSTDACGRVALGIYRNIVESQFAGMKRRGIGTVDMRALSLRDTGVVWVSGLALLLHTARRVAHETGIYGFFHDEYLELGLHRSGSLPDPERLTAAKQRRPASLRWGWEAPGRAAETRDDLAA